MSDPVVSALERVNAVLPSGDEAMRAVTQWGEPVVGPAVEGPRTLSKDEIIALALRAGFEKHESYHLSGNSEDDELLSVGEYPVGESVLMLAELIQEAIKR